MVEGFKKLSRCIGSWGLRFPVGSRQSSWKNAAGGLYRRGNGWMGAEGKNCPLRTRALQKLCLLVLDCNGSSHNCTMMYFPLILCTKQGQYSSGRHPKEYLGHLEVSVGILNPYPNVV